MRPLRHETLARSERYALADALLKVGPQRPTLCAGWDTADLLEHLYLRERKPYLLLGEKFPGAAGALRRWRNKPWQEQVDAFRYGGFPFLSCLDTFFNTAEYFVHHEDVRRAHPGWQRRELSGIQESQLMRPLRTLARLRLQERAEVILVAGKHGGIRIAGKGEGSVRVYGLPSELLLWVFGRRDASLVRIETSSKDLAYLFTSATNLPADAV
ncbi:TIGR03085 family protein [Dermabacteraceae bacterium TAE3-ERU27]|nr:TIGR03085 family protein [Dermabacteraceae bacterium TAE3-ERU27]